MEVLRSAFQTALVLDWGAAVAMAVVAVEVSLRLMAGPSPFERALAVLIITPGVLPAAAPLAQPLPRGVGRAGGAERLFAILDEPAATSAPRDDIPVSAGPVPGRRPPAGDHVRPGHRTAIPVAAGPAIAGLSLTIPAGARVAIVGADRAPASRRSLGLLLRFLEPDDGTIRVGRPTSRRSTRPTGGRRSPGCPQSPHLFHGTVADNLRLGRPDASDADLHAAVTLAGADDVIEGLPAGLRDADRRGRLPAERRRAPAAGDRPGARFATRRSSSSTSRPPTWTPRSRIGVDAAIGGLAGSRTVIVISHRPRLARSSDLVVVIDGGRLVELGRRPTCSDAGGAFAARRGLADDAAGLIEARRMTPDPWPAPRPAVVALAAGSPPGRRWGSWPSRSNVTLVATLGLPRQQGGGGDECRRAGPRDHGRPGAGDRAGGVPVPGALRDPSRDAAHPRRPAGVVLRRDRAARAGPAVDAPQRRPAGPDLGRRRHARGLRDPGRRPPDRGGARRPRSPACCWPRSIRCSASCCWCSSGWPGSSCRC